MPSEDALHNAGLPPAPALFVSGSIASAPAASTPVRGISSRRIQQQQQAKAAAAAAAAAAAEAAAAAATAAAANAGGSPSTAKAATQTSTMREVLASIPGLNSVKPRRRSNKKLTTAAQIEQTKDGKIDLETPDSILASTNLRALLNKQTFSLLPPLYQHNLIQLLPSVDREASEVVQPLQLEQPSTSSGGASISSSNSVANEAIRLSASCLNNEFFARACLEWRERLSEGEFTPENQIKLKTEAEREKNKLDPWKLKHFEPYWGEKNAKRAPNLNPPSSKLKLEPTRQQQRPVPPAPPPPAPPPTQQQQPQQQQLQQATCDNETELKFNTVGIRKLTKMIKL